MYDVFGLGNALVDTEVRVDDRFLTTHHLAKGHMTLVDSDQMQSLAEAISDLPQSSCSGGSAANTVYAVQALGKQGFYSCKLASDATGDFFIKDLAASGVNVNANAQAAEGVSGRCLVLITPDAERTMMTDLGISVELSTQEVNEDALRQSSYFYVEGYMSASPTATAAAVLCRQMAEANGVQVAVSLSDVSMVEFCREALQQMLGNGVDQLFCNEEEALAWAQTDRLDIAIAELKDIGREVYVTLGARGSLAIDAAGTGQAPGVQVQPVDTTGAGDIYAGACLVARSSGADPTAAAGFANACAAELVTHYGARLATQSDYQRLLARLV